MTFSKHLLAMTAGVLAAAVLVVWAVRRPEQGAYAPPLDVSDSAQTRFPFPEVEAAFQEAHRENDQVQAWLYLPGTDINEGVVQAADNDFYLRRNLKKQYSFAGSLFFDYRADPEALTRNTVIYGHNLGSPQGLRDDPDGVKFAQLLQFTREDFARSTPYLYLYTEGQKRVFQVFAAFYSEAYTRPVEYHHEDYSPAELEALIADMRDRSVFDYPVEVTGEDRLLTLSTCTYKYGSYAANPDQRFVVVGRLVEEGESYHPTVEVALNEDAKAPAFAR